MMIKDLEMHEDLARDKRTAVRGGNNTILPGGCVDPPLGPHVPTVEELLSKIGDLFKSPLPYPGQLPTDLQS